MYNEVTVQKFFPYETVYNAKLLAWVYSHLVFTLSRHVSQSMANARLKMLA